MSPKRRPGQASCKPAGPGRLGTLKSFNNLGTCCSKTLLRYVALGFAESDLWYLLHGCYRKGTLEKNAEAFRLGRVVADRMFIFRGIAASCKSSLLKAIIGLLRNHSLDFFKVGYGSLDLYEKSAVSKTTPKVGKFTDIVTREPRWTQMARCPNPNVAWFKMINQRQTRNNGSNA